ncbi:MAG TPA: hypothetical protein VFS62_15600 [Chloroflexota bacterium]|jgi:DNA-binding XRE family transcriptional regulator|nr:hypothetical protein [Chloroflexota bacterium]
MSEEQAEVTVPDEIELRPFYHDIKNTIVQPKQVVVGSRYFWERWAPRLKPTLTTLVVRLRMHCYYNQATQERRDWCFPTQQTLAEEVGVSRWTVMRELKRPEARLFVRVQYRSRYDPSRRLTVRISSLYHVAMDDPLVEEDRGRAALLAAEHMLAEAEQRHDPTCGISEPGRQVAERPFTGDAAKQLITQLATGPRGSKLPHKEEPEEVLNNVDAVAHELMAEQVSAAAAQHLAQHFPAEIIRQKMDLVRQLKEERTELRNVPGFLRKAIEDDYQRPLAATGTEGGNVSPLLTVRSSAQPLPLRPSEALPTPFALSDRAANTDAWQVAKRTLAVELRPAIYGQWVEPSTLLHYELGKLTVVVPDGRIQRYMEQRLRHHIETVLAAACGGPTHLEVIVEGETGNA